MGSCIEGIPLKRNAFSVEAQRRPDPAHGRIPLHPDHSVRRIHRLDRTSERRHLPIGPHPAYRFPQAARHQPRPPVPPVVVHRLAGDRAGLGPDGLGFVAGRNGPEGTVQGLLPHPHRTKELNGERVLPGQRQIGGRNPPRPVHVVGPQCNAAIDPHFRIGIQPAKFQGPLPFGRGRRKGATVRPIPVFHPLNFVLISIEKRRGNLTMGQQIGVDAPRYLRGQPSARGVLEFPSLIQHVLNRTHGVRATQTPSHHASDAQGDPRLPSKHAGKVPP